MTFELIGQLWLLSAAAVAILSFRATWLEWNYNSNVTKEALWLNEKQTQRSQQSRPHEALSERNTSVEEATWSLGAEVLARSLSIGKNNKVREPAAADGSKEQTCQ